MKFRRSSSPEPEINLIPFNPFPDSGYARSKPDAVSRFRDVLVRAELVATTRKTRGDDIAAACGQLAGQVQDKTRRAERRNQRHATDAGIQESDVEVLP